MAAEGVTMHVSSNELSAMDTGWWVDRLSASGGLCDCGRVGGVMLYYAPADSEQFPYGLLTVCSICAEPSDGQYRVPVRWAAYEVRPSLVEAGQRLQVVTWTRGSKTMSVDQLWAVWRTFERVERAREIVAVKPGSWSLARRDDGSLWAPWDPGQVTRGGAPLAYRAGRLAASTRARTCVVCKRALAVGETVMRPHAPGSTCHAHGWSPDATHTACVCLACAGAVEGAPAAPAKLRLVK